MFCLSPVRSARCIRGLYLDLSEAPPAVDNNNGKVEVTATIPGNLQTNGFGTPVNTMSRSRESGDNKEMSKNTTPGNNSQTNGRRPLALDRTPRLTTLPSAAFQHLRKTALIGADRANQMALQEKFVVLNGTYVLCTPAHRATTAVVGGSGLLSGGGGI